MPTRCERLVVFIFASIGDLLRDAPSDRGMSPSCEAEGFRGSFFAVHESGAGP
jgi:hypothetical protein